MRRVLNYNTDMLLVGVHVGVFAVSLFCSLSVGNEACEQIQPGRLQIRLAV